ncbi:tetratricopeptide repeat protein [Fibrobacterota bacterium]
MQIPERRFLKLFLLILSCWAVYAQGQTQGRGKKKFAIDEIQGDIQIKQHFNKLKTLAGQPGAGSRVKILCARGHSLNNELRQAAQLYSQVAKEDIKALQGNLDAIRVLFARKNYSLTIKLADNYLHYKPRDKEIREIQLKCYENTKAGNNKMHQAISDLVKVDPENNNWWLKLARLDRAMGDNASAIKHAKSWVKHHPQSVEGYKLLKALTANNKKESRTHAMALEKLVELEPGGSSVDNLKLGLLRYEEGNLQEAEKLLARAAKSHPKNAELWYKLGKIRSQPQFKSTGREEYKKAYELEPSRHEYAQAYGEQLNGNKEIKANLKLFRQICGKSASMMDRVKLAKSFFLNKEYASSAEEWEKVLKMDSSFIESESMVLEALLKAGRHDQLLPVYERKLKNDPDNLESLEIVLEIYRKSGNKDKSLAVLERIVELDPGHKDYKQQLAEEYKTQDKSDKAIENFKELVSQNPDNKHNVIALYELTRQQSDSGSMLRALEMIVKLPKAERKYKKDLGLMLVNIGEYGRAKKFLQECVSKKKFDEDISYGLYRIHLAQKNKAQARKTLRTIYEKVPYDKKYVYPMARLEAESNNFKAVVEILEQTTVKPELDEEMSFLLLIAYIQTKNIKTAAKYGQKLMKKYPESAKSSLSLATLFFEQKKIKAAKEILNHINETKPSPAVDYYLGLIAHREKNWKKAIELLEGAGDYNQKINFYLGSAFQHSGKYRKSVEAYKKYYANRKATLNTAREQYGEKNYPAAVVLYTKIVKSEKKDPKVWEEYGISLLEIGEISQARTAFKNAVQLGSKGNRLLINLAKIQMEEGDIDGAEESLTGIVGQKEDEHQVYQLLARISIMKKEFILAQNYLIMALRYDEGNVEYSADLGKLYYANNDLKEAIRVFAPVSSELPPDARMDYADALIRTKKIGSAIEVYRAIYKQQPSAELVSRLVDLYTETNNPDAALGLAKSSDFADEPGIQVAIAKAELAQGKVTEVQKRVKKWISKYMKNPEHRFLNGLCYYKRMKFELARGEFRAAIKYRTEYPEARYYMGLCELKLKNLKSAGKAFEYLCESEEKNWNAKGHLGLARIFEIEKDFKNMEMHLKKAVKLAPSAEVYNQLTLAALKNKRQKEAGIWAAKALALSPEDPRSVISKAEVLLAAGKSGPALKIVNKALKENPNSCDLMIALCKVFWKKGEDKKVFSHSTRAMELCPEHEMPYFFLGQVAHGLFDEKEARKNFKLFLKNGGDKEMLPKKY